MFFCDSFIILVLFLSYERWWLVRLEHARTTNKSTRSTTTAAATDSVAEQSLLDEHRRTAGSNNAKRFRYGRTTTTATNDAVGHYSKISAVRRHRHRVKERAAADDKHPTSMHHRHEGVRGQVARRAPL